MAQISTDSLHICKNSWRLLAPIDLRTPTSFALVKERAMDRLIKLILAMSMIKNASKNNVYTYIFLAPPVLLSKK